VLIHSRSHGSKRGLFKVCDEDRRARAFHFKLDYDQVCRVFRSPSGSRTVQELLE
jgi:hypothetical protein